MLQIMLKVFFTLCLVYGIFVVWTNEIDIKKTIIAPLSSIIKFKKHIKLDINVANTTFARCLLPGNTNNGNIGIALYDLKIVNSSEENSTIKEVILRYTLNGKVFTAESYVLLTGTLYSPLDKKDINAIIIRRGSDRVVLMRWNNLRTEIGEYKVLPPGGVLSGSALFVLGFDTIEALSKIKKLEMVIVDYSGTETVQEIMIQSNRIEDAKYSSIENRSFSIDQAGNTKYSD